MKKRIESGTLLELKKAVWLCALICWKKKHEWCCTALWMQTGRECAKKKKEKGERDGRNCRGLWCTKQCRIWKRLGNVFGKEKRKLDGKSGFGVCGMFKWFRNTNNTIQNIKTTKDFVGITILEFCHLVVERKKISGIKGGMWNRLLGVGFGRDRKWNE